MARLSARSTKHRILAVDDDWNLCYLMQFLLEETGRFEVQTETDSEYAVTAAKLFRPHLIILDLNMPCTSGPQLARNIAAEPDLERPRILFLTGMISGELPQNRNGIFHVPKTAGAKVLIETIDRALGL